MATGSKYSEVTLDEAIDAFDADRSQDNAYQLLAVAKEYHDDEMIGAVEFAALKAQADEAL